MEKIYLVGKKQSDQKKGDSEKLHWLLDPFLFRFINHFADLSKMVCTV